MDKVAGELERLQVDVAGLQEAHWFGSVVLEANGSTILIAGRDVPPAVERFSVRMSSRPSGDNILNSNLD